MNKYKVFAIDEYFNKFTMFESIDESSLNTYLHSENCECVNDYGDVYFLVSKSEMEKFNIPYKAMSYIIKYTKI